MGLSKVLVVDDDYEIAQAIEKMLQREGYDTFKAHDGFQALDVIQNEDIKLILMDVMMPKLDGLSTMLKIREKKNIPIIILSAKSEETDKILGLSMGADDYITKPCGSQELIARVKSQLRRYLTLGDVTASQIDQCLSVGGIIMDVETMQVSVDGEPIKLTSKEFKILELLMSNPGVVFSADKIYERVWNEAPYAVENTVMVHIRHIREKIEINPKDPKYLKVVWGIGYKIEKF